MDIALFTAEGAAFLLRWIHFLSGVMWIGMLWYFNFVQGAWFAEAEASVKNAAISKLVPRALWWFRYGALFTWFSGFFLLALYGHQFGMEYFSTSRGVTILTGAGLGTLMFLNVWLIIWPNQKVVIASAQKVVSGGQADPAAAACGAKAGLASRHNTLFSIPMLFMMGASSHLSVQTSPESKTCAYAIGVAVILGALELNSIKGKLGPLTTITGVIHCGLALSLVLYGMLEFLL